ncbi:39S ribosomal protein L45 [Spatholobus suberectus]|nr:39S ribosomal protein L45 [Spatholobus suberectus]
MMTPFKRLHLVCTLYRSSQIGESSSYLLGNCKSYSSALSNGSEGNFRSFHPYPHLLKSHDGFPFAGVKSLTLRSTMAAELSIFMNDKRMVATQVKPQTHSRQVAQQLTIASPGFIYEPYEPREKIPFWKRWFTRSGWRRTKNDILLELKNAYAIAKLRKKGYSKNQFYNEATNMYKEINTLIANGDKRSLRKAVTEKMFSALKNEIKQRETTWGKVYWEMVEPVVKIRTLRARLIGVDRKDLDKVFIQLTLEILVKQKFEAYDSKGSVVAGDKSKEVLVRDIWVFEKSLFHPGARWLLCGRISPKASQLSP